MSEPANDLARDIRIVAGLAEDTLDREYGDRGTWGDTPKRLLAMVHRVIEHANALEPTNLAE